MKHQPMTIEQIHQMSENREFKQFEEGAGNFEVLTAENATAKESGNPMIKLKLRAYDKNGTSQFVFDQLIGIGSMEWKTRSFCECVGALEIYEEEVIDPMKLIGKTGDAEFCKQKDSEKYFMVKRYKMPEKLDEKTITDGPSSSNELDSDVFDDDIKF